MPIKVWNPKDHTVHLRSFDGDSVMIAAKARGVRVANKFDWQVPSFMRVARMGDEPVDPTRIVKGRSVIPLRKPPKSHNKDGTVVPENRLTAAEMREKADAKRRAREAAAQRAALARQQSQRQPAPGPQGK